MIPEAPSCFPSNQSSHTYLDVNEDLVSSTVNHHQASSSTSNSPLLYSMSLLKEKVHQVQSLVTTFISPNQRQPSESNTIAITAMGTLIQEIIVIASSMMFTCQNLVMGSNPIENNTSQELHNLRVKPQEERGQGEGQGRGQGQGIYAREIHDWHNNNYDSFNMRDYSDRETVVVNQHKALSVPLPENTYATARSTEHTRARDLPPKDGKSEVSPNNYDIIELDAANLLAKYTHYCQVCGKGFKRDANLRMHMRAHGDEYKSSAALSNPMKNLRGQNGNNNEEDRVFPKKYSCPQEGCRWNKNHAKFQPLKSMICVKNHYKRSHCPKTYVCKSCNRKQFSVLSDLRTHEKHCGDLKWQCSCGNTFSRKDKLIGHLGLFVGHSPVMSSLTKTGRVKQTGQGP